MKGVGALRGAAFLVLFTRRMVVNHLAMHPLLHRFLSIFEDVNFLTKWRNVNQS